MTFKQALVNCQALVLVNYQRGNSPQHLSTNCHHCNYTQKSYFWLTHGHNLFLEIQSQFHQGVPEQKPNKHKQQKCLKWLLGLLTVSLICLWKKIFQQTSICAEVRTGGYVQGQLFHVEIAQKCRHLSQMGSNNLKKVCSRNQLSEWPSCT